MTSDACRTLATRAATLANELMDRFECPAVVTVMYPRRDDDLAIVVSAGWPAHPSDAATLRRMAALLTEAATDIEKKGADK